jgi:hypothetical protein
MNRFAVTFIVLAATGGCLGVDQDPMTEYESPRRTPTTQPWAGGQSGWRGSDGRPVQTAGVSSYGNTYTSQTTSASSSGTSALKVPAISTAGSTTKTTAAKTAVKSSHSIDSDLDVNSPLTKATYTVVPAVKTKREESHSSESSATKSTKTDLPIVPAKSFTTEAKAPPINLGVLRLLNSKSITFHYEVKDPGTTGVGDMELWGTKDMRSWKKYEITSRKPGAIVVDVKEEGLYGFTMIARGKAEAAKNQPPQAGDAPQVWVAVDLTKPTVELTGADLNISSATPALVVRWSAKDTNFGPKPVTLFYAERLDGPWSPIAANMANTGRYDWTMPACVPGKVFVRVQATDMMGNIGMAQSAELHIPGRPTIARHGEPTNIEPPRLVSVPTQPLESAVRPIAATVTNPAVSILSVEGN